MTKRCQRCGALISTDDYYKFIRMKYCRPCAENVHREQKAAWIKELRRKTREEHNLTKQLCKAQQEELVRLRQMLAIQRDRNRVLAAEIEEAGGR